MAVGNQTLDIPNSVFYAEPEPSFYSSDPDPLFLPDAIFDSGTSFTIIPDAAYTVLTESVSTTFLEPVYTPRAVLIIVLSDRGRFFRR
jgi:hypothetical protein